ncbi:lipopolysaccharide biosynthesis protein [Metallibacterium scheffleri]|uniref:Uncharacterized protein n=1 Tax=Metallibacterium scheffleri TaxID=993689 RepID=A0A4V6RR90_9GAMM|nr:oligosaccharide flippase family protein [Metallibacterium scheffleri]THD09541.1 hypothetical protein B1806_10760 [Metallibacterium scheffleri]
MRRAIFYTSGAQIAIQLIGLVTGILVARWLGPDGRGQLAAVISWAALFAYLGNVGIPVAYTYASAKEPARRHQLLGNGLVAAGLQWLVLAALGIWLLPVVLASHGTVLAHLAVLYLLAYVPLNLLTLYINAIQQGSGQYARFNVVRLSVSAGYVLLLVLFWAFGHMNVESVVSANLLSNVLTLALALSLTLPMLVRRGQESPLGWFDVKTLWGDLRYGLSAHIGTLQPFSGLQIDVLALTMLVGVHDLGLYMAALAGASLLRAQGFALGQVVLPEVAKCSQRQEQMKIILKFAGIAGLGGTLALLVVLLWASPLLRLVYGSAFLPASPILKALTFAGLLGAVYRVLADGLRGMGRPFASTIAELVGLGVGIPALAVGIPVWGVLGAAQAVVAASAGSLAVAVWFTWRSSLSSGTSIPERDMDSATLDGASQP